MIATRDFLFIHLHKTGGQFVNRLLLEHIPDARRIGYHLPRREAPEELKPLPTFAFMRNPWDWYVSWYAFNAATPQRNPIFRAVSEQGEADFNDTITNLLHLGHPLNAAMREQIASQLPESREGNLGSGITRSVMQGFTDPDAGYLTWLTRYMCFTGGSPAGLRMGRMEQLREDLVSLLEGNAVALTPQLRDAIATAPVVNASPRRDYRGYYDAELREMVAERDWAIVESYGYEF
ncbi:MAG TPA: hypothetical protein VGM16_12800 [Gammaproteobacteria bacterium]|jgi:hypothetical protein